MAWNTFPLQVERSRHITPHILEVAFKRIDGAPFEYKAGQFLNVHFDVDGAPVHRSYSVATPPGADGIFEIAVSPVKGGLATELFFGLQPGDVIQASGPYGRFVLRDDPSCRLVLAATGTGVTPYRAMLPELQRRIADEDFEVELLLGVWSPEELLYGEEFLAVAQAQARFRFHACYSREFPDAPQVWERRGYVQAHFDSLELNPEADIVYLCGNPDMIDQAADTLRAQGFPSRNLRREKYLPSRTGR